MNNKNSDNEPTREQTNSAASSASVFGDLSNLRQRQDFHTLAGVRQRQATVPVGKPSKQTWFRTHPGEEYQLLALILEWDEDGSVFFVLPGSPAAIELSGEGTLVNLRLFVTAQASAGIWALKQPQPDGRDHTAWESARRVAEVSETDWARMVWNRELSGYDIYTASVEYGEPRWPEQSFGELLDTAFRGKIIESVDHPVVAALRGRSR